MAVFWFQKYDSDSAAELKSHDGKIFSFIYCEGTIIFIKKITSQPDTSIHLFRIYYTGKILPKFMRMYSMWDCGHVILRDIKNYKAGVLAFKVCIMYFETIIQNT